MKKYIAPELEVELYSLDASIAGSCVVEKATQINHAIATCSDNVDAYTNENPFSVSGGGYPTATQAPKSNLYATPFNGNQVDCSCNETASGVMLLATS